MDNNKSDPGEEIRVLIIDDHKIVLEGLQMMLSEAESILKVHIAQSGHEGISLLRKEKIDVVLLDIDMPEMDGITCCQKILLQDPGQKVIALTMINERSLVRRMLEAGAVGFLLKNTGREELIRAIRRVLTGKSYYSADIADILIKGNSVKKSKGNKLFPSISSREKQILRLILEEFTTAQIAERLNISFNTVETHRRNIMHKLGAKNMAGLVKITIENHLLEADQE